MTTPATGFHLEGDRKLRATLEVAGRDLSDLSEPNEKAAELVRRASKPTRKSGRLARSLRGDGTADTATISSDEIYAGVQHDGWPAKHIPAQQFITKAALSTEPAVIPIYEEAVDDALAKVKGAHQ